MEQPIPKPTSRASEADYLRMEETAKSKHEFRDGSVIDMAGGTEEHADIAANLIYTLRGRLKGTPCKAYGSDLRVRISESGNYCYPDVMVICGGAEFYNPPSRVTALNPRLIFEVTSPSTEADDRGDKFTDYRRIETFQEYVLVSQIRPQVESFYRQADGVWAIGPTIAEMGQSVRLHSLDIEIPLGEIYAEIVFPVAETKPSAG